MKTFNSFDADIKEIAYILMRYGCDMIDENNKIYFAYDASSPYNYSFATKDGIYNYREVCKDGYVLKKRLTCYDIRSSFLIICAEATFFLKHKEVFNKQEYDYLRIKSILSNYAYAIIKTVPLSNQPNPLLKKYFRVIEE